MFRFAVLAVGPDDVNITATMESVAGVPATAHNLR
jgi:hypothetical protein